MCKNMYIAVLYIANNNNSTTFIKVEGEKIYLLIKYRHEIVNLSLLVSKGLKSTLKSLPGYTVVFIRSYLLYLNTCI